MSAIVHFEIPFDEEERAKKFYEELFGWKMEEFSPGMGYWMITTQEGTGGGMMKRQRPDQKIVDYFDVSSVLASSAKAEELGGKILVPKTAIPKWVTLRSALTRKAMFLAFMRTIPMPGENEKRKGG